MPIDVVKKTDIAWFTGIIEGEGSIKYYPDNGTNHHKWRITIVNTDLEILNKCMNILNKINVRYCFSERKMGGRKRVYSIQMQSLSHIQCLLKIIAPYIVGEKRKDTLLLSMIKPKIRKDGKRSNATKHIAPIDNQIQLFN